MTDPTLSETEKQHPEFAGTDAPSESEAPRDPIEALVAQREAAIQDASEMKDKLLRTLAEMENLRRRTEREVQDARAYGVTSFARDILAVSDNIRRAFESVGESAETAGPLKAFVEGIAMTERELLKTLEKHGVKMIEPQGEKFDPNKHQAMFEVPNADLPNGTIVQVIQAGFLIGERVLRPALVGVSKGGPKAAPAAEAEQG